MKFDFFLFKFTPNLEYMEQNVIDDMQVFIFS